MARRMAGGWFYEEAVSRGICGCGVRDGAWPCGLQRRRVIGVGLDVGVRVGFGFGFSLGFWIFDGVVG